MTRARLTLVLFLPFLMAAEGDCGGKGGDDPTFGSGSGSGSDDGGGDDGGGDDGGTTGDDGGGSDGGGDSGGGDGGGDGGAGDDTFTFVSVDCEGDNTEYTWTFYAELSIQASFVKVELDPGTSDWEAWDLVALDAAGTQWEEQVTELLSSRDCSVPAHLKWTAFGFGSWEETYESEYVP